MSPIADVRVFLNPHAPTARCYRPEHPVVEVAAFRTARLWDDTSVLEKAFLLFTLGADPADDPGHRAAARRGGRNRPLAVGDVVAVDDRHYACTATGWERLAAAPATTRAAADGVTPLPLEELALDAVLAEPPPARRHLVAV